MDRFPEPSRIVGGRPRSRAGGGGRLRPCRACGGARRNRDPRRRRCRGGRRGERDGAVLRGSGRTVRRHLAARHRSDRARHRRGARFRFQRLGRQVRPARRRHDRAAAGEAARQAGRLLQLGARRRRDRRRRHRRRRHDRTMPSQPQSQPHAGQGADRGAPARRPRPDAGRVARRRAAQRPYRWPCRQPRALRRAGAARAAGGGGERPQLAGLSTCRARRPCGGAGGGDDPVAGPRAPRRGGRAGELHELLYRQRRGGGAALRQRERRCRGGRDPGAVPRPRGGGPARRPYPHRRRQLPLHQPADPGAGGTRRVCGLMWRA